MLVVVVGVMYRVLFLCGCLLQYCWWITNQSALDSCAAGVLKLQSVFITSTVVLVLKADCTFWGVSGSLPQAESDQG
jgi:hypothetical protein